MQFVVETAGIADRLPTSVPSPQSRRVRFAIDAGDASPLLSVLKIEIFSFVSWTKGGFQRIRVFNGKVS